MSGLVLNIVIAIAAFLLGAAIGRPALAALKALIVRK